MTSKLPLLLVLLMTNILFGQITKVEYKVEKIFTEQEEQLLSAKVFNYQLAQQIAEKKIKHEADRKPYIEFLTREFKARHAVKNNFTSDSHKHPQPVPTPNNANCPNAGFENYDFSNWSGDTWTNSSSSWTVTPVWTPGTITSMFNAGLLDPNARHTILTMPPGNNNPALGAIVGWDSLCRDQTTGFCEIPLVCPTGSGVSVRLGNANSGNQSERLVYTMAVNSSNSQFVYNYAVALNNPAGHPTDAQPFFKITVRDQAGNLIGGQCGIYNIDGLAASSDPLFETSQLQINWDALLYKNWTTVGINLSAYVGQTVTIEFWTADCAYGGHSGYAYIDASCGAMGIALNFCSGQTNALLVAPAGFSNYQWFGPNSTTTPIPGANCANCDSIYVNSPNVGDIYYCTATSLNGCQTTYSATVNYTTVSISGTGSMPSCQGGFSGQASVTATGSLNGYNYSWTDVSTGNAVGGNTSTITGLSPGTYSVVVSSPGCGQYDTTVVVSISPPVFYSNSLQFCLSPAPVTAPAGSNYVWYDPFGNLITGANSQTLNVPNPMDGDAYTTVFNNASGCKDSIKYTLTQTVNTSTLSTTFCGTSATLCAPAGATNVVWYDANWPYAQIGTGNCITIQNPVTSTWSPYAYAYTNPTTGCKDSIRITLTNIPSSIYASNITPSCFGDSTGGSTLNINSGFATTFTLTVTGPATYTNNTASATTALTNLPVGSYTAVFSDGQCTDTTTFTIDTMFVNVTTSVTPDTLCPGQQAVVTFNYGGGTPTGCAVANSGCATTSLYTVGTGTAQNFNTGWPCPYGNWYSNEKYQILYTAADLAAAGVSAGKLTSIAFDVASIPVGMNQTFLNYQIKIGCTSVSDLDPAGTSWGVPFVTPVTQTIWGPQNYVVTTGWNTHTFSQAYEWDGVSNIIVEICYDWVAQSNYTYNAIMNLTNTTYRSFLLYNSDVTVACPQTTSNQSFMQRPNTRFTHCLSISTPADFTYSWSPNTGVAGVPPTVTITPTVTTTYSVTITSNAGGCSKMDTIPLFVINPFTITMPPSPTYCVANPTDTLTAVTNPVQSTGVWTGSGMTDGGNSSDGYFNPGVAGIGNHYAVFTAGAVGCQVTDSVLIVVNNSADATVNAAGPFCITDNAINIGTVQPGGTFSGPGITNTATGTFNPSTAGAGTANISYIISGMCSDTGYVDIIVYPQPVISISSDTTEGCNPTNISFNSTVPAPANGNAQWFFGDGFVGNSQNMIHQYADTGTYSVTFIYTDANGCSDTIVNNNMIQIHPSVTAAFLATPNETTIIDPVVYFTNQSINADSYVWEFMNDSTSTLQDPTYMFVEPGTFNITLWASNQWGCIDSVTNVVIVQPDIAVYVPNAFTPGDENNLNDVFLPYISGIDISTYRMEIYDRWGEQIFHTEDMAEGWNGRRNNTGVNVESEVYVYKIYYKDNKNKKRTYVGHVTVVK